MNKKYLYSLCAASMLLMTSCQKDNLFGGLFQDNQEPVTVKMNVALPEMQSATRAQAQFGNGYSAQKLNYAVYEIIPSAKNVDIDTIYIASQEVRDADMEKQLSKTIALKLMPGSTYEVIFWAQHHAEKSETAPYQCNFNKVVGNAVVAEVTLDYDKLYTNNEINDAFWGKVRINNVPLDGGNVLDLGTVTLKRPFAQLNIGTADLEEAANAGFPVDKVSVEIPTGVCDVLNLWTGKSSCSKEISRTFKKNDIVDTELYAFPVAGYDHLAMNYLLVNAEKSPLNNVTLNYYSGDRVKSRTFSNVPAQRNWRTNIYGELLTSDVNVNVVIDPLFADQNGVDDDPTIAEDNKEWYDQKQN